MNNVFNGSNWNKWDLHLHTPYTYLNCQYKCDMPTWARAIKAANIKVIGLTNYFIIAEEEYSEAVASLGKDILVIPNVEFRTTTEMRIMTISTFMCCLIPLGYL
jgi:DNA repair protein SbcC/Rad50